MKTLYLCLLSVFSCVIVRSQTNSGSVQTLLDSRYPILDPSFVQGPFYGLNEMLYITTDSSSTSIWIRTVAPDSFAWMNPSLVFTNSNPKRFPVGGFVTMDEPVVFWEEASAGSSTIRYSLLKDSAWTNPSIVMPSVYPQSRPIVGNMLFQYDPIILGWIENDSVVTVSWCPDSVYSVRRWKKDPGAHISSPVASIDFSYGLCAWQEGTDSSETIQWVTIDDSSKIQTLDDGDEIANRNPGFIRGAGTLVWSTGRGQPVNLLAERFLPWYLPPYGLGQLTDETEGECIFGGGELYPLVTSVPRLQKASEYTMYNFVAWRWRFEDSSAIVLFYPPLYPPTRKEIWSRDSLTLPVVTLPLFKRDTMSFWTVWVESNAEEWRLNSTLTSFYYTNGGVAPYHPEKMVLLSQNYPNPFNPGTTIRFSIPSRSQVRLTIFNLLGQQIAQLADEEMNAGSYERMWNAGVASGMYFYRIEAVSVADGKRYVDVKKMVLVR